MVILSESAFLQCGSCEESPRCRERNDFNVHQEFRPGKTTVDAAAKIQETPVSIFYHPRRYKFPRISVTAGPCFRDRCARQEVVLYSRPKRGEQASVSASPPFVMSF
jgi:hypothetical protein